MSSVVRVCARPGCSGVVTSNQAKACFCCSLCAKREHSRLWNVKVAEQRRVKRAGRYCERDGCSEPLPDSARSNRRFCSTRCVNMNNHRTNPGLHTEKAARWRKANPEKFRDMVAKVTHRRRQITESPHAEYFTPTEIGDRDGWICGICVEPIDRTICIPRPIVASA